MRFSLGRKRPKTSRFMGDSITEFWGVINPKFFEGKAYVNHWNQRTNKPTAVAFRADVIALKPSAVVI
jgi:hypothetical protein